MVLKIKQIIYTYSHNILQNKKCYVKTIPITLYISCINTPHKHYTYMVPKPCKKKTYNLIFCHALIYSYKLLSSQKAKLIPWAQIPESLNEENK